MSASDRSEILRGLQDQALTRYARTRVTSEERLAQPPRTGEIFAFPQTADRAIFWAVVEELHGERGRFRMVAADLDPRAGTRDVAVSSDGENAAWCLRCGISVRLDPVDFQEARRIAFLDSEVIRRAALKRAAVEAGTSAGSVLEQETEAEPEYQDWLEELAKARTTLTDRPRETTVETLEAVELRAPLRTKTFGRFSALAASILLVVTLGLLGGIFWQRQAIHRIELESETLETVHLQKLELLDQERKRLEEEHRRELAARSELEEAYRDEIARLKEGSRSIDEPTVNVAFGLLPRAAAVRGERRTLTVPAAAVYLFLILETSEDYPFYRLEIADEETRTPVWSLEEMTKVGATELTALLPRRQLPDGEYRLRLFGRLGGLSEPLAEYRVLVRSP